MRFYSIIVPVYNRPEEVAELLASLRDQVYDNFEVLIIEDGSNTPCQDVVKGYAKDLDVHYYFKENGGQGFARNYGFQKAKGDFFIVFDSDCLIPKDYLSIVDNFLDENEVDAFGGPDRAHPDFNALQKAISYSMTSPLTTGGIRGRKKHVGQFHPRSFNMGISSEVFDKTAGYRLTRMGEDIEFSIRIILSGFKTALIPDAYVYHKRRSSLGQFYKQLHFFGRARVNVNRYYKGQMKLVHLLPLLFVIAFFSWLSTPYWFYPLFELGAWFFGVYYTAIFIDSLVKSKELRVAMLSTVTSFVQLYAYGMGIISEVLAPRGNQPFAQK